MQFWIVFAVGFAATAFLTMPVSVALVCILAGLLFSAVTWASARVR